MIKPEVPAKPTSFSVTLSDVIAKKDEYLTIKLGNGTKTFAISTDLIADATNGKDLTVHASSIAASIVTAFGANQTIRGQAFTLSADGSTLKLVQNQVPTSAAEVVPAEYDFKVEFSTFKPAQVTGTPKDQAAFGDKADVEKLTTQDYSFIPDNLTG